MSAQLELLRLNTGRQVRVSAATRMLKQYLFRYQGYVGTYLVLGGVDVTGPHLATIYAAGSSDKTPFTAMGSGMLAAMSVLETRWKPDMEVRPRRFRRNSTVRYTYNNSEFSCSGGRCKEAGKRCHCWRHLQRHGVGF